MVFSLDEMDRSDWPLFRSGAVNLYRRAEVFEDAILDLITLRYRILRLRFQTIPQFQNDLSLALNWQEQFGYFPWTGNLDALNDGFRSEPFDSAEDNAVCIENFDALVKSDPTLSFALLDMIACHSRAYLLFGKRLVGLIQTNDPKFSCPGIGKSSAMWNEAEQLDRARGL